MPAKNYISLPFEPTNLDKVFFPEPGYTKGDLFNYYEAISEYLLPYIKDRPLALNRMPDGISGESFFQKNNKYLPEWVTSADIYSESHGYDLHWIVGGDLSTLLYLVQLGSFEINPWSARVDTLRFPDWAIIDLDPEEISFKNVVKVAKTVRQVCDELHAPCYPKTSGQSGLHIYLPLKKRMSYDECMNYARLIATEVNQRLPQITSLVRDPDKRSKLVYVDYLQNRSGQTVAAPYSVRPTPLATVSTPLSWDEVNDELNPHEFTIRTTVQRLKKHGDLWGL